MDITTFQPEYLRDAADLFIANFRKLRANLPFLPATLTEPDQVISRLRLLMKGSPSVAALENGQLIGFLGWFLIPNFRGTGNKAGYCPEWGHASREDGRFSIYRAMYRAAAAHWSTAGCQTHCVSFLAHDRAAERAWFWSGFGLAVVDALRPINPPGCLPPTHLTVRQAGMADAGVLARLDFEHCEHYSQPPTLMTPRTHDDADDWERFLAQPPNSAWLALQGAQPVGFLRFESSSDGAAEIVQSDSTISITGAYVRPPFRGQGAAPALLDAALQMYAARGFARCAVDFEAFNLDAAMLWLKYFDPVCLSVIRSPERRIPPEGLRPVE